MKPSDVHYESLKTYSTLFVVYKWTKRIRMTAFRLLLVAFMFFTTYLLYTDQTYAYFLQGAILFNPLGLIVFWFLLKIALLTFMQHSIDGFVKANTGFGLASINFSDRKNPKSPMSRMNVPSFRGKPLRVSMAPIVGTLEAGQFGLFARHYKEGGLLRWRERQMDTVMWYDISSTVPHIIINARANERAKLSNLSERFDQSWKFQFEGTVGESFDAYVAKEHRITALQLFTPDVLAVLYEKLPHVDIEIKNGTIWFVWRYAVLNDKVARTLFESTGELMAQLQKQIRSRRV